MKIAREQKEIIDPRYVLVPRTRIYNVIAAIEQIKELEYIKFAYQDSPRLLDRLVLEILAHAMVNLNTRYIQYQLKQYCFIEIYKMQKIKKLNKRKIKCKNHKVKYPSLAKYPQTKKRIFLK